MNTPPIFERAARAPHQAHPQVDEERLQELAESIGIPVMRELLEIFRQESQPRLGRLALGCLAGDATVVRAEAHFLSGSSANLGLMQLAQKFHRLELQTRNPFGVEMAAMGRVMEQELAGACSAWEGALADLEAGH